MEKKKSKMKYVVIVAAILVTFFLIARYGWRIQGLRACTSVYDVNVTVSDSMVEVEGYTVCPFCRFIGHAYKIEDNKLYVGVKAREFLGVLPGIKEASIYKYL